MMHLLKATASLFAASATARTSISSSDGSMNAADAVESKTTSLGTPVIADASALSSTHYNTLITRILPRDPDFTSLRRSNPPAVTTNSPASDPTYWREEQRQQQQQPPAGLHSFAYKMTLALMKEHEDARWQGTPVVVVDTEYLHNGTKFSDSFGMDFEHCYGRDLPGEWGKFLPADQHAALYVHGGRFCDRSRRLGDAADALDDTWIRWKGNQFNVPTARHCVLGKFCGPPAELWENCKGEALAMVCTITGTREWVPGPKEGEWVEGEGTVDTDLW